KFVATISLSTKKPLPRQTGCPAESCIDKSTTDGKARRAISAGVSDPVDALGSAPTVTRAVAAQTDRTSAIADDFIKQKEPRLLVVYLGGGRPRNIFDVSAKQGTRQVPVAS